MAESGDYRAVEYWPNDELRIIFTVRRTPETDAMTDEELIRKHGPRIGEDEKQRQRKARHLHVVGDE
ncbi:hypothetical protein ACFY9A_28905 [Streptomyces rubradiris]|uniref:hypothetical protein n=1 Tax=Streptomyces rubradiris TaxID=285531 RepID=UPI0036EEE5FE